MIIELLTQACALVNDPDLDIQNTLPYVIGGWVRTVVFWAIVGGFLIFCSVVLISFFGNLIIKPIMYLWVMIKYPPD